MPERLEKLRATVSELEDELQSLDSLDDKSRALLKETAAEIHSALQEEDPSHLKPESVSQRLQNSVEHFEAEHPALAAVVNRIVDALGQMGI